MSYLDTIRKVKKELAEQATAPEDANRPAGLTAKEIIDIDAGAILAVLIDSPILGAEIWFALDESFKPDPGDGRAVFYASELPLLRNKTPDELRGIHRAKKVFGGGKAFQNSDPIPPACWNCDEPMARTKDISGKPWWACWSCARTA